MVDIEKEVFIKISEAVKKEFPNAHVTSEEYARTSKFLPCVTVVEYDNQFPYDRIDNNDQIEYAVVVYKIDCYSNKPIGRKSECREILGVADKEMQYLNFTRMSINPTPNMEDSTVYRMTALYRAITDGKQMYTRQ